MEENKKELLSALENLRNVSYKQTLLMLAFLGVIFYGDNVEKAVLIIYTLAEKTGVESVFWVFGAFVQLFFIFVVYWAYCFHECCRLWKENVIQRDCSDVKLSLIYSCISAALYVSATFCSLAVFVRVLSSISEVIGKLFGGLFGILLMVLLPIVPFCVLIRLLKGEKLLTSVLILSIVMLVISGWVNIAVGNNKVQAKVQPKNDTIYCCRCHESENEDKASSSNLYSCDTIVLQINPLNKIEPSGKTVILLTTKNE